MKRFKIHQDEHVKTPSKKIRIAQFILCIVCTGFGVYLFKTILLTILLLILILSVSAFFTLLTAADLLAGLFYHPIHWKIWLIISLIATTWFGICSGFLLLQLGSINFLRIIISGVFYFFTSLAFLCDVIFIISYLKTKEPTKLSEPSLTVNDISVQRRSGSIRAPISDEVDEIQILVEPKPLKPESPLRKSSSGEEIIKKTSVLEKPPVTSLHRNETETSTKLTKPPSTMLMESPSSKLTQSPSTKLMKPLGKDSLDDQFVPFCRPQTCSAVCSKTPKGFILVALNKLRPSTTDSHKNADTIDYEVPKSPVQLTPHRIPCEGVIYTIRDDVLSSNKPSISSLVSGEAELENSRSTTAVKENISVKRSSILRSENKSPLKHYVIVVDNGKDELNENEIQKESKVRHLELKKASYTKIKSVRKQQSQNEEDELSTCLICCKSSPKNSNWLGESREVVVIDPKQSMEYKDESPELDLNTDVQKPFKRSLNTPSLPSEKRHLTEEMQIHTNEINNKIPLAPSISTDYASIHQPYREISEESIETEMETVPQNESNEELPEIYEYQRRRLTSIKSEPQYIFELSPYSKQYGVPLKTTRPLDEFKPSQCLSKRIPEPIAQIPSQPKVEYYESKHSQIVQCPTPESSKSSTSSPPEKKKKSVDSNRPKSCQSMASPENFVSEQSTQVSVTRVTPSTSTKEESTQVLDTQVNYSRSRLPRPIGAFRASQYGNTVPPTEAGVMPMAYNTCGQSPQVVHHQYHQNLCMCGRIHYESTTITHGVVEQCTHYGHVCDSANYVNPMPGQDDPDFQLNLPSSNNSLTASSPRTSPSPRKISRRDGLDHHDEETNEPVRRSQNSNERKMDTSIDEVMLLCDSQTYEQLIKNQHEEQERSPEFHLAQPSKPLQKRPQTVETVNLPGSVDRSPVLPECRRSQSYTKISSDRRASPAPKRCSTNSRSEW